MFPLFIRKLDLVTLLTEKSPKTRGIQFLITRYALIIVILTFIPGIFGIVALSNIQSETTTYVESEYSDLTTDENYLSLINRFNDTQFHAISTFFVFFIFCGLYTIWLVKGISNPLNKLEESVTEVSEGDLTLKVEFVKSPPAEILKLKNSFDKMKTNLAEMLNTVKETTFATSSSAEELAATAEEVNALSEEIAASIQQISRGASNQSILSSQAIEEVTSMVRIVDNAINDIENTLTIIDDIAEQTNILALNAAIEAARAGESGRGFAVVADNVRRLAEDTKGNSADIGVLVNKIANDLGGSVVALQEILQNFAAQSEEFSAVSEEVAAATEEQTAAMNQLTKSAQRLTSRAEKVSKNTAVFKT